MTPAVCFYLLVLVFNPPALFFYLLLDVSVQVMCEDVGWTAVQLMPAVSWLWSLNRAQSCSTVSLRHSCVSIMNCTLNEPLTSLPIFQTTEDMNYISSHTLSPSFPLVFAFTLHVHQYILSHLFLCIYGSRALNGTYCSFTCCSVRHISFTFFSGSGCVNIISINPVKSHWWGIKWETHHKTVCEDSFTFSCSTLIPLGPVSTVLSPLVVSTCNCGSVFIF